MMDIKFNILFSDRAKKNITMRIVGADMVEIIVPQDIPRAYVEELIEQKRGLLENKLAEYKNFLNKRTCFALDYGSFTPLFGIKFGIYAEFDRYEKTTVSGLAGSVENELLCDPIICGCGRFDGGFIIPPELTGVQIEKALESIYIAIAKRYLPERTAIIAARSGMDCPPIRITSAKKQWGSCIHDRRHSDTRICYSWRIMLASPHAIDSVIIHELCHINEPNHGDRFWRHVKNIIPDYSNMSEELRNLGGMMAACWHI